MKKIWAIAINTFRENIRDRILYNLLAFALMIILLSIALVQLSTGEWQRITIDVGLSGISIFGSLIAIFLGISLVSKEMERRTIYTLLSKPVPRPFFMLGKYLGLALTIIVNLAIMAVVYLIVLYYLKGHFTWAQAQAIILILVKLLIVAAIALFFSTFTTPTLSAIFTLSIFIIGHLTNDIKTFGERAGKPIINYLSAVIYYLLPNLSNYSWLENATYGDIKPGREFLITILIGIFTAGLILILASALLFHLSWGAGLPVLVLVLAAVVAAVGWGMLITALARTSGQVSALGSAITLTFGMLGGTFINMDNMPAWFRVLSKVTPNAWGMDGFVTLALGGRLADIRTPVAALLAMGALLFIIAVLILNRRGLAQA